MKVLLYYVNEIYACGLESVIKSIDNSIEICHISVLEDIEPILEEIPFDMFVTNRDYFEPEYMVPLIKKNNTNMKIVIFEDSHKSDDGLLISKYKIDALLHINYSKFKIQNIFQMIVNGLTYIPPEIFEKKGIELTPQEKIILELMRKGYSNKQIAYDIQSCENTIKVHVSHIMKKFGCTNRILTIKKALDMGMIDF